MRRRLGRSAQLGSLATWQRYTLFQLPGIAVVCALATLGAYWFSLPAWMIPTAVAVWVVKDVLLYPALKTAYEGAKPVGQESMVGLVGTATEDLCPRGQVRIGPELWRAESSTTVPAGHAVRVTGSDGMTMLVEPEKPDGDQDR
ncbi:MAG: NfeD family protein [Bryobacterales bacterium]|nr:NfeD family protein [Bryobacterales bacterium]